MCPKVSHSFVRLVGQLVLVRPAAVVVGAAVAGVPLQSAQVADKTVGDFVRLMAVALVC